MIGGIFFKDIGDHVGYYHIAKDGTYDFAAWEKEWMRRTHLFAGPIPLLQPGLPPSMKPVVLKAFKGLFFKGMTAKTLVLDGLEDTDLNGNVGWQYAFQEPIPKKSFTKANVTVVPAGAFLGPTYK